MPLQVSTADANVAESKQDKMSVWLYSAVAILLIALIVLVYALISGGKSGIIVARSDSSCNLREGPCQAVFPNGGKVTLSISPRPIQERKQLHLQVRLQGIDAKSVYVNFLGQNMYMGYNRPKLKLITPGQFAGTWTLASCGLFVEHMEWKTMVLIQTAGQRMAATFPLETQPITESSAQ